MHAPERGQGNWTPRRATNRAINASARGVGAGVSRYRLRQSNCGEEPRSPCRRISGERRTGGGRSRHGGRADGGTTAHGTSGATFRGRRKHKQRRRTQRQDRLHCLHRVCEGKQPSRDDGGREAAREPDLQSALVSESRGQIRARQSPRECFHDCEIVPQESRPPPSRTSPARCCWRRTTRRATCRA